MADPCNTATRRAPAWLKTLQQHRAPHAADKLVPENEQRRLLVQGSQEATLALVRVELEQPPLDESLASFEETQAVEEVSASPGGSPAGRKV